MQILSTAGPRFPVAETPQAGLLAFLKVSQSVDRSPIPSVSVAGRPEGRSVDLTDDRTGVGVAAQLQLMSNS